MIKKVGVAAVGTLLVLAVLLVGGYVFRDDLPLGVRGVVRDTPFVVEVLNVLAGRSGKAIGDGQDAIAATGSIYTPVHTGRWHNTIAGDGGSAATKGHRKYAG